MKKYSRKERQEGFTLFHGLRDFITHPLPLLHVNWSVRQNINTGIMSWSKACHFMFLNWRKTGRNQGQNIPSKLCPKWLSSLTMKFLLLSLSVIIMTRLIHCCSNHPTYYFLICSKVGDETSNVHVFWEVLYVTYMVQQPSSSAPPQIHVHFKIQITLARLQEFQKSQSSCIS